jgi:hypothetical protein
MSGVGGYVRRSERKPSGPVERYRRVYHGPYWPHPEPPLFQSMPMLRFEPFVVAEDDTGLYLDADGMRGIRSRHEQRTV